MKVFCVFQMFEYEGDDLLGVFTTEEKADKAIEEHLKKWKFMRPQDLIKEEWEVDKELK